MLRFNFLAATILVAILATGTEGKKLRSASRRRSNQKDKQERKLWYNRANPWASTWSGTTQQRTSNLYATNYNNKNAKSAKSSSSQPMMYTAPQNNMYTPPKTPSTGSVQIANFGCANAAGLTTCLTTSLTGVVTLAPCGTSPGGQWWVKEPVVGSTFQGAFQLRNQLTNNCLNVPAACADTIQVTMGFCGITGTQFIDEGLSASLTSTGCWLSPAATGVRTIVVGAECTGEFLVRSYIPQNAVQSTWAEIGQTYMST